MGDGEIEIRWYIDENTCSPRMLSEVRSEGFGPSVGWQMKPLIREGEIPSNSPQLKVAESTLDLSVLASTLPAVSAQTPCVSPYLLWPPGVPKHLWPDPGGPPFTCVSDGWVIAVHPARGRALVSLLGPQMYPSKPTCTPHPPPRKALSEGQVHT